MHRPNFGATPPFLRRWRAVVIDFVILRGNLAAKSHLSSVAAFHHWFLLQLPNFGYALSYDSRTCIALLAAVGRFCPKSDAPRPIIGAFGLHTFRAVADCVSTA